MINTKLAAQAAITRTITDRITFELDHTGKLTLFDARGISYGDVVIVAGSPQKVEYSTRTTDFCGAVVVQQSEWEILCYAESSVVLGNVDFPYQRGAAYKVYPQKERARKISVEFSKQANGALIEVRVEDGRLAQRVEIPNPTNPTKRIAFKAALIAYSELKVVKEPGMDPAGQLRITNMSAGGDVIMTPPWNDPKVPNPLVMLSEVK